MNQSTRYPAHPIFLASRLKGATAGSSEGQYREMAQNDRGRTAQDKAGTSKNANNYGQDQQGSRH